MGSCRFSRSISAPMGFNRCRNRSRSWTPLLCSRSRSRWAVLPAIAVAVVVYGVLVLALGAVTRQDVLDLPKGEKIARMLHLH